MRQPQVCKHQCVHCGGRFGMVTHRWWGSKFCKRTCKDAYLREVTLDRDTIRRWFGLPLARHKPWQCRYGRRIEAMRFDDDKPPLAKWGKMNFG
jgi:hypothetical protein